MSVTVLWYQMDATVSKLTKMGQKDLKSVVELKSEVPAAWPPQKSGLCRYPQWAFGI